MPFPGGRVAGKPIGGAPKPGGLCGIGRGRGGGIITGRGGIGMGWYHTLGYNPMEIRGLLSVSQ